MIRRFVCVLLLLSAVAAAQTAKENVLWQKLEERIRQTAQQLDGVMGVAILDLNTGRQILINGDEVMPQASSIKIALLAELYRQAQEGKLKLDELYTLRQQDVVGGSGILVNMGTGTVTMSLRDLAILMVGLSDNTATNILIDRVGMDNVNALMDRLGLKNTRLKRRMIDITAAREGRENVSTPREMMSLLQAIYEGKVLNKQFAEDYLKVLSTPKDSPLSSAIPGSVRVASKPGDLDGVRAESGIVFVPGRPFVICVMTTFIKQLGDGGQVIRQVGTDAYSLFDRLSASSPLGRGLR